jgi:hypothetical protein
VPVFFESSNEFYMSLKCAEDNPPLVSDLEEVALMRRMLLFITVAAMLLAFAVPAFAQGQVE